jgi:isopenicillin N synthase-like dioxygenase
MPDITSFNNSDSMPDRISSARLPIVDISSYLCDGSSEIDRATTRRDLDAACRDFGGSFESPAYIRLILTGFFYVVGHGLDPEYLKSLLQLGHRFFDLPQDVKESIHISKSMDGVRGWQKVTYQLEISVWI